MNLSKQARELAKDLDLSEVDAYLMEIKTKLYKKVARLINDSEQTHQEIANLIGTSRARVSRLAKMGEISVSLEILIKLSAVLENKAPIKVVA